MVLGKYDRYMQKNESRPLTFTIHKNIFKMAKRLKCKLGNHKSPGRNHWQQISNICNSNMFMDTYPRTKETMDKIN